MTREEIYNLFYDEQIELARYSKDVKVLEYLSKYEDHLNLSSVRSYRIDVLREFIASNINTPINVLMDLSQDENIWVRLKVAEQINTPISVLIELSKDEEYHIRSMVAANSNTSEDVLEYISKDTNKYVRCQVAKHPSTPISILIELSKDEYSSVRCGVLINPNTPLYLVKRIFKDKKFNREEYFENIIYINEEKGVNPKFLEFLSKYKDKEVQKFYKEIIEHRETESKKYWMNNPKEKEEILSYFSFNK